MFDDLTPDGPPSFSVRPWKPPVPPRPAAHGRLLAMARAILLAAHGRDARKPWAAEILSDIVSATKRLSREDKERLQDELDRAVDGLNEVGVGDEG